MVFNELSQLKAKSLDAGKYADGQGLWLVKYRKSSGRWMLRLAVNGKRREMGLGPWLDVAIAESRERASLARRRLRDGVDPIQERQQQRQKTHRLSVQEAVESCLTARLAQLKNDDKAGRWLSPLNIHVLPKIGQTPIEGIDQHEVKRVLDPIWHAKASTARKAMDRLSLTLKHAAALGLDVDLQAVMKAQALLGKQRHEVKHIPSLPYHEALKFYRWICQKDFASGLALRFLILTLGRVSEINGDVWTLAPDRTKTGKEHRIPLSKEALDVVDIAKRSDDQKLMFPTPQGKAMSDMALGVFMKREGYEARPHGFRATFRTWVEEQTDTPLGVKESTLGHNVDSGIVGAYQRLARLDKRAAVMERWAKFLTSPH